MRPSYVDFDIIDAVPVILAIKIMPNTVWRFIMNMFDYFMKKFVSNLIF